ncbi:MAG: 16S rRNA processing protein RimM [Calditrichaeota bacterium]|nr:16S rRNA processing protein RimM [Calditrichota bacterium]MCB0294729.1 16S rRNA processing protein RimM [Calditrichota bacterium]MCB0304184.1 16S rRNA processing protein RimM [Calditrichota bacterium]MCB0313710.1 16S rRNA processing protein RimM [Calditrichota bacterium]MCB9090018.1 16S rRNA processing protein RimM [Calditrichia bacterium]
MYITIGKIVQTHGVQGYVKAITYSDIPGRFENLKTVYLETDGEMRGLIIEAVQDGHDATLLKFRGIDDRESARKLVRQEVWVPESEKIELPADNFFVFELIGLQVFDIEGGEFLGTVEEVLTGAGNDVYVIRNGEAEILLPAVREFVKSIDRSAKRMEVQLIEGMRD